MVKQCRFFDVNPLDSGFSLGNEYSGIKLEDGSVVCACCGSIFEPDEVAATIKAVTGDTAIVISRIYDEWVDFSDYIKD